MAPDSGAFSYLRGESERLTSTFENEAYVIKHQRNTHVIETETVIDLITKASVGEKSTIVMILQKIGFANGNVHDFLKHLATLDTSRKISHTSNLSEASMFPAFGTLLSAFFNLRKVLTFYIIKPNMQLCSIFP